MKGTTMLVNCAMRFKPPKITKQRMDEMIAALTVASRLKASSQAAAIVLLCTPGQKIVEARIVTIAKVQA